MAIDTGIQIVSTTVGDGSEGQLIMKWIGGGLIVRNTDSLFVSFEMKSYEYGFVHFLLFELNFELVCWNWVLVQVQHLPWYYAANQK